MRETGYFTEARNPLKTLLGSSQGFARSVLSLSTRLILSHSLQPFPTRAGRLARMHLDEFYVRRLIKWSTFPFLVQNTIRYISETFT